MAFDLIIFDCDGVLVDSEIIALRVLTDELAARLPGVAFAPLLEGVAGLQTNAILQRIESHLGISLPDGTLAAIDQATSDALDQSLQPIAGVAAALAQILHPRAVASNSTLYRLRRSLDATGLTASFDPHVFSAEQVAHPKPAPDLYLHIAALLGYAPKACLVIEDSVAGATAAHEAGMTVVGFTGAGHVAPGQADRLRDVGATIVLSEMTALPGLIDTLETP